MKLVAGTGSVKRLANDRHLAVLKFAERKIPGFSRDVDSRPCVELETVMAEEIANVNEGIEHRRSLFHKESHGQAGG
jgi:hypothetical protein